MTRSSPLIAAAAVLCLTAATSADVRDAAHLFSPAAVTNADSAMQQMQQRHNKTLVFETIPSVSAAHMEAAKADPDNYFKTASRDRMKQLGVNGVYVLVCMDPKHFEVTPGEETFTRGDFARADVERLTATLRADLHGGKDDQALSDAVDDVERAYTANISGGRNPAARQSAGSGMVSPPMAAPSGPAPYRPSSNTPRPSTGGFHMIGLGSLICVGIGLLIIFSLVKSVLGRRTGGGGGFGGGGFGGGGGMAGGPNYPTGGPNYGPGQQNYGGGPVNTGGGGGFGRGLLGGLLGGAAGGYVENKIEHRNDGPAQSAGYGGGDAGGGSFGGGGGGSGFDSGPSDAGQAADFSGGGDFGGGGGDAGGGGGGDSGGGGGDSGGGSF